MSFYSDVNFHFIIVKKGETFMPEYWIIQDFKIYTIDEGITNRSNKSTYKQPITLIHGGMCLKKAPKTSSYL